MKGKESNDFNAEQEGNRVKDNRVIMNEVTKSEVQEPNSTMPSPPPPAYPQAQIHATTDVENSGSPGKSVLLAEPTQRYNSQAGFRTLHVYYQGWCTAGRILDEDKVTELYTLKSNLKKPHLTVECASTGSTLGTATLHWTANRIDVSVKGDKPFSLKRRGFFKSGYTYASPALGRGITWKSHSHNLDLVCLDEQDIQMAKFCFNNWSMKKVGKFEFFTAEVDHNDVMEEILMTGLTMLEYAMFVENSSGVRII